jgi:hypothetical protein
MSLKSLPFRAPAAKVLPRKRTVGERIVATLEFAALVRTLSRVIGRNKRRRLPSRGGLLAIAGGGVLAAVIAVLLKRKAGGEDASTPAPAPTEAVKKDEPKPADDATSDSAADHVEDADPVPAAVDAAKKLDADGGTAESPAVEEKS